jgi:hypothetical protein
MKPDLALRQCLASKSTEEAEISDVAALADGMIRHGSYRICVGCRHER